MNGSVAIVGGGLTGLSLARRLTGAGVDFRLFEARERLGGRISSPHLGPDAFDLGPSWFWPGQFRMAALVQDLGLDVFEQYATGALLYETEHGEVIRDRGFSSMQGSFRMRGGMAAMVDALVRNLPKGCVETGQPVQNVFANGSLSFANGDLVSSERVVLALPPRVAADLTFEPELTPAVRSALQAIPTWMAGHAKLVVVYDTPFWRSDGLSGDAMSRKGPLAEVHDASTDGHGALFGFLGVPASVRAWQSDAVIEASIAQLGQMFGPRAASPIKVFYTDWAQETGTAVAADQQPLSHHPTYGRDGILQEPIGGNVFVASSELASDMGGYLEGALSAADDAAKWVLGT